MVYWRWRFRQEMFWTGDSRSSEDWIYFTPVSCLPGSQLWLGGKGRKAVGRIRRVVTNAHRGRFSEASLFHSFFQGPFFRGCYSWLSFSVGGRLWLRTLQSPRILLGLSIGLTLLRFLGRFEPHLLSWAMSHAIIKVLVVGWTLAVFVPTISKAVPWSGIVIGKGRPPKTDTPLSKPKPISLIAIWPWSWYKLTAQSYFLSQIFNIRCHWEKDLRL